MTEKPTPFDPSQYLESEEDLAVISIDPSVVTEIQL